MNIEDKIEKSVSLFKEGYNCSQSVVAAFAEDYGFTREQALKMSASFGGGIGRMRETCGAACGLFMLAGLVTFESTGFRIQPRNVKRINKRTKNNGKIFFFINVSPFKRWIKTQ